MLKESSNHIERNMANVIEQHFPYYEIFWDVFLVDGIGKDDHWKDGPLERIGIANYGILKSLNFIRIHYDKIKVNDENQTFKNVYFHFGLICELIPYCGRYVYEFLKTLGVDDCRLSFEKQNEFTKKEIAKVIKCFLPDDKLFAKALSFYKNVTTYRHFFTHNPGIDVLNRNNEMLVVDRNQIEKCKTLSNIRQLENKYLVNPKKQVYDDFIEILSVLNIIWQGLYEKMSEGKANFPDKYYNLVK